MYRFVLLYITPDRKPYFSEGMIHVDKAVYVRGFYPDEGMVFPDLDALQCYLCNNEDICFHHIHMIDELPKPASNGI